MAGSVRGRQRMGQAYPGISAFSTNLTPETVPAQPQIGFEARYDVTEFADPLAAPGAGATSSDRPTESFPDEIAEEIGLDPVLLNQVSEEARLATGATGAA